MHHSTGLAPPRLDFRAVRSLTARLAQPLSDEDMLVQSMPDCSPAKWHLAHTTWFFETFVLAPAVPGYAPFHPRFGFLFNSYYEAVGQRVARSRRHTLSRPGVGEVMCYRDHVDEALSSLLPALSPESLALVELGLHHEQQHQELLLADILHAFASNPLRPGYRESPPAPVAASPLRWIPCEGGTGEIGHAGPGFSFDNETPRHAVLAAPYRLASRLATNAEYQAFIDDGGYARPELWLSDGWEAVRREGWAAPLYWEDGQRMTLDGMQAIDPHAPCATSASSRPTPTPAGRGIACRPRPSGSWPRPRRKARSWRGAGSFPPGRATRGCRRWPARRGNGRPAPTWAIRDTAPPRGPSASTTASS